MLQKTLYSGADDSNHAGDNKKGEIIAVTFSFDCEDNIVRRYVNRRDQEKVQAWLDSGQRDYRFTLLADEDARKRSYNLVLVAPLLVREYLKQNPGINIDTLAINLDGPINGNQKRFIKNDFPNLRAVVEGFCKRNHYAVRNSTKRKPVCAEMPYVVVAADILAHKLYTSHTLEELLAHQKFIPVSHEEILSREKWLMR